jgi:hypothetical protein
VRFRFDPNTARISFGRPVSIAGTVLPAGGYDLVITSGAQTGVKVWIDGGEVADHRLTDLTLGFDLHASLATLALSPDGRVMIRPIIRQLGGG